MGAAIVVGAVIAVAFSRLTLVDDAFITFRYAKNFAHGLGLVFNVGEPVEGSTSLLWTLVLALASALGARLELVAVVLSLACALAAVLIARGLLRESGVAIAIRIPALFALVALQGYWLAAANGLEGGAAALFAILTVRAMRREQPVPAGLFAFLCFATRPDSALVLPAAALALVVARRESWRSCMTALSIFAACVLIEEAWRLAYFHALFPNSMQAKRPPLDRAILRRAIASGLDYLEGFAKNSPIIAGLLAPALIAAWWRREILPLVAPVVLYLPVVLLNGGDWMADYRLLMPYAPLAVVAGALALDTAARLVPARVRPGLTTLLGGVLVASAFVSVRGGRWRDHANFVIADPPCYPAVIQRLAPVLRDSDRVALDGAGVFSYRAPHGYMHDIWGLADAHIAKTGVFCGNLGRLDRLYSEETIRPTLWVSHGNPWHYRETSQATNGKFERENNVYQLDALLSAPGCESPMYIAAPKIDDARFVAALSELKPRLLEKY